jgi:hypothetical protein
LYPDQYNLGLQGSHVQLNQSPAYQPDRKHHQESSPGKAHGLGFLPRWLSDRRDNWRLANLGRIDRVLAGDADTARGR